jgi:hypothetical protein
MFECAYFEFFIERNVTKILYQCAMYLEKPETENFSSRALGKLAPLPYKLCRYL